MEYSIPVNCFLRNFFHNAMNSRILFFLLLFSAACNSAQTENRAGNAPSPAGETAPAATSPSAASAGLLDRTWVFESVFGYRDGQVLADTVGLAMFNNSMAGQEMTFKDGNFFKKSSGATASGTFTVSEDNKVLTTIDASGTKIFNIVELTSTHLKLHSPQLRSIVVGYTAK